MIRTKKIENKFIKNSIFVEDMAEKFARKISKEIDKATMAKVPLENLEGLKELIDEELERRDKIVSLQR